MGLVLGESYALGIKGGMVDNLWDGFIHEFCKVSIVCYKGEPNWLGWGLLALLGIALINLVMQIWSDATLNKWFRRLIWAYAGFWAIYAVLIAVKSLIKS